MTPLPRLRRFRRLALELAALVQRSVLPPRAALDETTFYATCWRPKDAVSGDLYEALALEDGSRLYVTSQGKQGSGGQAMGIYRICTHTGLAGLWAAKQARRLAAATSKDAGNRKDEAGRSEGAKGSQTPAAAPSPAQAPARQDSQAPEGKAPESKTPGDATSGQSRDRVDAGGSEGSKESRTPAAEASPAQIPAGQSSQAPESKTPESKTPGNETSGQSRDRDQQGSAPQASGKEAWPGERPAEGAKVR